MRNEKRKWRNKKWKRRTRQQFCTEAESDIRITRSRSRFSELNWNYFVFTYIHAYIHTCTQWRSGLHKRWRAYTIASYPGLLAPAFVACSTNAGEGLVHGKTESRGMKYLDVWRSGTFPASKRVLYRSQTQTVERLSARHQTVLATFLGFIYSCTEEMCHSSHTSRYVKPRDPVFCKRRTLGREGLGASDESAVAQDPSI